MLRLFSAFGPTTKRFCSLLVLSMGCFLGCATHQGDLRPETGFRGIAWGTPIDNIPHMTPLEKGGGRWKWATREPEQLKLGDVAVDSINYIYVDGAFAGVDVAFSGADTFGQLMQQLEKTMGPPNVVNKKMNMLSWNQNGTTVLLRYYRMQGSGEIKYTLDSMVAK